MSPATVYDARTSLSGRKELTINQLSQHKVRSSFPVWIRPIEHDLSNDQAHVYAGHFVMTGNWRPLGRNSQTVEGLISAYNEFSGEEIRAQARLTMTPGRSRKPKLSIQVTP